MFYYVYFKTVKYDIKQYSLLLRTGNIISLGCGNMEDYFISCYIAEGIHPRDLLFSVEDGRDSK